VPLLEVRCKLLFEGCGYHEQKSAPGAFVNHPTRRHRKNTAETEEVCSPDDE
jgi:hypothetical protein